MEVSGNTSVASHKSIFYIGRDENASNVDKEDGDKHGNGERAAEEHDFVQCWFDGWVGCLQMFTNKQTIFEKII
jgi:hypothetical protein